MKLAAREWFYLWNALRYFWFRSVQIWFYLRQYISRIFTYLFRLRPLDPVHVGAQKYVAFPSGAKCIRAGSVQINSQSLEDTQVEYISQKYTSDIYTFEKYTFGKYTFEKYALRFTLFTFHHPRCIITFHLSLRATRDWKSESVTNQPTDGLTWVGARDTCVSKNNRL